MKYQSKIENLYDFKKEMMDVLPEICRMTVQDTHGEIEKLIIENMDKLEERHWKAVFNPQYNELFEDGIPHVSWNTDRSGVVTALMNRAKDDRFRRYKKVAMDSWPETWRDIRVMYVETPCGAVVKCQVESPRVWDSYSRTQYCGSVVPPEEVPARATHTVVLIGCDTYGKAGIYAQFTGTMGQCEEWVAEQARRRGREMPEVKFIPLRE